VELDGKRVLVTGAASGMGAAGVRALTAAGARVGGLDISDDAGASVADAATRAGPGTAAYRHCDVTDRAQVVATFDEAAADLGGLDALVHAAGLERSAPAEDITEDDWHVMLDVNARGTFVTNQAVFPHLRERGGRVVNFASGAGVRGMPGGAAYSAAKGAVLAWSRTVAVEWARFGITVNAVVPAIWTPMYQAHRDRLSAEELVAHDARMAISVPLGGKLGDPDHDMAPVLVFLVSDAARFMTASTVCVDGGHTILT
jgi:NAD(P)-dependent dehydrogenase (short-subunit alcohol dehydrogenase family)